MLASLLRQIDGLSAEVTRQLAPHAATIARPSTIPGAGQRTAELPVSELGTDKTRFPTPIARFMEDCRGARRHGR